MKQHMRQAICSHDIKMSARPEFYSGRGANTGDLNSTILERFHEVITLEHGKDAAKAFTLMVADMQSLSATAFLNRLYMLEADQWQYIPRDQDPLADGIDVGPDDDGREAIGMLSIAGALSDRPDETESIRGEFIRKHRDELPEEFAKKLLKKRTVWNVSGFISPYGDWR